MKQFGIRKASWIVRFNQSIWWKLHLSSRKHPVYQTNETDATVAFPNLADETRLGALRRLSGIG